MLNLKCERHPHNIFHQVGMPAHFNSEKFLPGSRFELYANLTTIHQVHQNQGENFSLV